MQPRDIEGYIERLLDKLDEFGGTYEDGPHTSLDWSDSFGFLRGRIRFHDTSALEYSIVVMGRDD